MALTSSGRAGSGELGHLSGKRALADVFAVGETQTLLVTPEGCGRY